MEGGRSVLVMVAVVVVRVIVESGTVLVGRLGGGGISWWIREGDLG